MNQQHHHTTDFKLRAVKYYLDNRDTVTHRDVCNIFDCEYASL